KPINMSRSLFIASQVFLFESPYRWTFDSNDLLSMTFSEAKPKDYLFALVLLISPWDSENGRFKPTSTKTRTLSLRNFINYSMHSNKKTVIPSFQTVESQS
ncbi:hypothetical protein ACJX0J_009764, partial [Zea mays]